jgi:Cu+-exporting ATPase
MQSQSFVITGMTCANCAQRVSKALNASPLVDDANVNLATEKAKVTFDEHATPDQIIGIVKDAGYGAILNDKAHQEAIARAQKKAARRLKWSVIVGIVLTIPMLAAMVEQVFGGHMLMFFHNPWVQFGLALPVQVILGACFYVGAYKALKNGAANMDVLVALGTTVAFVSSVVFGLVLGHRDAVQFESSAVIITLVLLGKWLESGAKRQTVTAIQGLMAMKATTVHLATGEDAPISKVGVGELIRILPGEKVPLDAEVVDGWSSVDQASLTGEAMPVEKAPGKMVYEGSLNQSAVLTARVVHTSNQSTLSQMAELMEEAQAQKPNVQLLADKISAIFVPVVLGIALVTFIGTWFATRELEVSMLRAVATLVIACPCALGLATPTAVLAGTGLGAKHGILIKNSDVFELVSKVKTVFFDKTGTLTNPEFEIVSSGGSDDDLARLASLEAQATSPIAMAFHGLTTGYAVSEVQDLPGRGLTGVIDGVDYYAGNAKLMTWLGLTVEAVEHTVVYFATATQLLATVTLQASVKDGAREALEVLGQHGLERIVLTGDHQVAANQLTSSLPLDAVRADLLPQDKQELVAASPDAMMVGDGINDAIALSQATVGVAMGNGSDLALEAADVTILGGDIAKVPILFKLGHVTLRKIHQNYFWAFIYNVIGIPLAAFGYLNPMIAALAMSMSSVSVIVSSLMLRNHKL